MFSMLVYISTIVCVCVNSIKIIVKIIIIVIIFLLIYIIYYQAHMHTYTKIQDITSNLNELVVA